MKKISEYFNTCLKDIRENTGNSQYRIRTLNAKSNLNLINYLNKYPLMGRKHLDYISWCEIANVFIAGNVKHKELLPKAIEIKRQMNDQRKEFTWDHLKDFYSL